MGEWGDDRGGKGKVGTGAVLVSYHFISCNLINVFLFHII